MTRRGLLAAGTAVLVGGCGSTDDEDRSGLPGTSDTGRRADGEVVNALLAVEHVAVAAGGDPDRVRRLEGTFRRLRLPGTPVAPADVAVPDRPAARVDVLRTVVAAYVDAVPKLSDRRLRRLAGQLLAGVGADLAVARADAGGPAVPGAFERGAVGRYGP